jgi:ribosomal protein S18 acetylase RimI-like enzyme
MIIRQASKCDIDDMVNLLEQLFTIEEDYIIDHSKQRAGLELLIEQPGSSYILVAESGEKVIGMLTAQMFISTAEGGKVAILEDMVVDEKFRRQGIGKDLMKEMEKWAVQNNIKRIQLLADKDNISALHFYDKLALKYTQLICLRKYID